MSAAAVARLGLGLVATMYVAVFGTVPFQEGARQVFYGIEILALMAIPLLVLSGSLMHAAGIAVIVSIHSSIGTTLWCGAACYLLLAPIAINLARLRRIEPDGVAVPAAS